MLIKIKGKISEREITGKDGLRIKLQSDFQSFQKGNILKILRSLFREYEDKLIFTYRNGKFELVSYIPYTPLFGEYRYTQKLGAQYRVFEIPASSIEFRKFDVKRFCEEIDTLYEFLKNMNPCDDGMFVQERFNLVRKFSHRFLFRFTDKITGLTFEPAITIYPGATFYLGIKDNVVEFVDRTIHGLLRYDCELEEEIRQADFVIEV